MGSLSHLLNTLTPLSDIRPLDIGFEDCLPNKHFGPFIRSFYLLHYIVSGKGTFRTPRGTFTVTKGQLFIIRPDEVTLYQASKEDPWRYIWVGFDGKLSHIFKEAPDVMTLDDGELFASMLRFESYGTMKEYYLAGLIHCLITKLFGSAEPLQGVRPDYVRIASDYIDRNYMQSLSVEDIAQKLHLSRRYLSRLFKEQHGITLQAYIQTTRMHHAYAFLQKGYSVSDTAAMSGYTDVFHFSKSFKRFHGLSPSAVCRQSKNIVK